MRVEAIMWTGIAVFYAVLATIYLAVGGRAAGGALLLIAIGFAALIGVWLWRRTQEAPPPAEDRADADLVDAPGELGTFAAESWRPLALAAAATMVLLGLIVGAWLTLLGGVLLVTQVVGLVGDQR
jgi:hypothetical protein